MKKVLFRGCGTAIATPFTEDNINLTEFAKLVEYQINEGIDAIIVCGTTGESSTMTLEEKKTLIKFSVELIDKRVPLIVGAGSNNTATSIEMSQYAESVGADGLLLVTPYYNKTTQEGLIHHYNSIANKTTLPIILSQAFENGNLSYSFFLNFLQTDITIVNHIYNYRLLLTMYKNHG